MSTCILLVDDNDVFRRPLQRTLEAAGFDGLQLITRIKATPPAVAIIAMTAYGTTESAVEARRRGANDYLLKPIEVPDLLGAIHRALDQQKPPARGRAMSR